MIGNYAVVIPALNPEEELAEYVDRLLEQGAAHIIVVDDGSSRDRAHIFSKLTTKKRCTVLHHPVNRGKGRALKTAFSYFLDHLGNLSGVITADSDGQHSAEDVEKVAAALEHNRDSIILGSRDFSLEYVPPKSKFGNQLTSFLFKVLYGENIGDTQTGLRGIPKQELPWMIKLKGERFEYEMNMLIYARKMNVRIREVPIRTIYFNRNEGTHYRSVKDSLKIFRKILSGLFYYSYPALLFFIIDILSFSFLYHYVINGIPHLWKLLAATAASQIIAFAVLLLVKQKLLKWKRFLVKYIFVCLSFIVVSFLLIEAGSGLLQFNLVFAKAAASVLLALAFYQIQLHWDVFDAFYQHGHLAGERRHG
ncbi:dolichol-phosphate mannosyltransferase [Weizmannia acidilactici]|uniref:glycosyltransferase family 2 protein n=1 Tax=Weizmannia acidilactici TaxID=2607726 RepID=UPI00124E3CD4|nr:glycosyltransferase family 2 protein [Weizmannia acidilactici]GER67521.1 dolichol-phosphate mannosyltransferase [Weizmannia acidilactici]